MELLNRYNEYTALNKEYLEFVEQLIETEFEKFSEEDIKSYLKETENRMQCLMENISDLKVEIEQETNLKDLKYLVMDSVFLLGDLIHFYQLGELGRFKMRALNAINKKRRAEMFKETPSGNGSCPIHMM